jgi:hypothetical protein
LEQDRCTFGTISNERFHEWLSKAKALRDQEGRLLDGQFVSVGGRYERINNVRFAQLSQGADRIEEKMAVAHAMLRADGFVLRSVSPDEKNPYLKARSVVIFRYERFGRDGLQYLCIFGCTEEVGVALSWLGTPRAYQIDIQYSPGPDMVRGQRAPRVFQHPHQCPPTPPQA